MKKSVDSITKRKRKKLLKSDSDRCVNDLRCRSITNAKYLVFFSLVFGIIIGSLSIRPVQALEFLKKILKPRFTKL